MARRIFINAGALIDAKTPNEIIGVLAHETGHIAGGHLSRLRQQLAQAQAASIIAMLLGIGGAVAAGRSGGNVGNPAAAILGPQETIRRSLLSYQRAQEEQADRAGVKFLTATGQSAKGMYDTFKRLSDQILFAAQQCRSLSAVASDAGGTRRRARGHRQDQSQLGQEGSAGAAAAARHDARQARRLPRSRRHGRAPLSRRATPACRRAMRAPSRPIATPTCAPPSARSTA